MNVGIIDIEPDIYNTVYMQIAAYHKEYGDTVGWWEPINDSGFDRVYCSSIFDYTDKTSVPIRAIRGGTGFDIKSKLGPKMETAPLDYSIYPDCDRSFLRFSRGRVRRCLWCVVSKKEGYIRPIEIKNLNPTGQYIVVSDNNFFANPLWENAIKTLRTINMPVDFQGVDARTLDKEKCEALLSLRHHKRIKIAWDNPKEDLFDKLYWLTQIIAAWRLLCYVLVGYDSTVQEDLHRIYTLEGLGIEPWVMPYNKFNPYQKKLKRYVNRKAHFKKCSWNDFENDYKKGDDKNDDEANLFET